MNKISYDEKFKEAFLLIKKRIIWIVLFSIVIGILAGYYKSFTPARYTAKAIFYPDTKAAGMSGSPLELLGGNANKGPLNVMAKVLVSRALTTRLAANTLQAPYNSKYKILADWIIDDNNKNFLPWEKKVDLNSLSKDEKIEKAAKILRNGCITIFDENGFMSLINYCYSSDLALAENRIVIEGLIQFNYDFNSHKIKSDLRYITNRVDSIKEIYENLKYQNAQFNDVNKYMIKSVVKVPLEDLEENKRMIASRYSKLVELQEEAIVRYETDRPIIKLLDSSYIDGVKKPPIFLMGGILFLVALILSILFTIRHVLSFIIKSEIANMRNKQA